MKLYTTCYQSPLGGLTIVCSDEHLKAVLFREEEPSILTEQHLLLQQCTEQLEEYFAGRRKLFDLPLLQEGTEFQKKVWTLLCTIPYGKTISYQQLADQYGDRKAIRAVAAANGKNNLAILVPCHRVIGSNDSLTGYAGGLWRKKWLLEHETKLQAGVEQLGFAFT